MNIRWVCLWLLFSFPLSASLFLPEKLESLDPLSITQHLAFHMLYPDTQEGTAALAHAWRLLSKGTLSQLVTFPIIDPANLISVMTKKRFETPPLLTEEQLIAVETLSQSLSNRRLKGHQIWTREELLSLPPDEIDLGRGVLLEQFEEAIEPIRQYEAILDLIALQVLARLPRYPSIQLQIEEINQAIFQQMYVRFPPNSLYAEEIDRYTFLPSVIDRRSGVCLGVSILYLCIAQRIGLPLEIVTPPGHIYLRYREGDYQINIETTARGVDLPTEQYLGIDTRYLPTKNLKQTIGLIFVNEASIYWSQKEYHKTLHLYEKARYYLPEDPVLDFLLGLNYLFLGNQKEGNLRLQKYRHYTFNWLLSAETIATDYFHHNIDLEGMQTLFLPIKEERKSIEQRKNRLEEVAQQHPKFRAGLLQLAMSWLQLGNHAQALQTLQQYHSFDPNHPVVEYHLCLIAIDQMNYPKAWDHLHRVEQILHPHTSLVIRSLRNHLRHLSPEILEQPHLEASSP